MVNDRLYVILPLDLLEFTRDAGQLLGMRFQTLNQLNVVVEVSRKIFETQRRIGHGASLKRRPKEDYAFDFAVPTLHEQIPILAFLRSTVFNYSERKIQGL